MSSGKEESGYLNAAVLLLPVGAAKLKRNADKVKTLADTRIVPVSHLLLTAFLGGGYLNIQRRVLINSKFQCSSSA